MRLRKFTEAVDKAAEPSAVVKQRGEPSAFEVKVGSQEGRSVRQEPRSITQPLQLEGMLDVGHARVDEDLLVRQAGAVVNVRDARSSAQGPHVCIIDACGCSSWQLCPSAGVVEGLAVNE